ncbi:MAG: ATP-binding protein [Alphaproteobacteria bacterium]|nr:ATP-binding protein [Alphaproteobacteria bacterium]
MLLEIKIKNFFSFAEEQVFSMIPNTELKKHKDVLLLGKNKKPVALPVAAIYGANASGKSNFIRAFQFLTLFLTREPFQNINPRYFLYGNKYQNEPTEITVSYCKNGYVYEYLVLIKGQYIVKELLKREDSNNNRTIIFSRNGAATLDGKSYTYDYDFIEDIKSNNLYVESLKKLVLAERTMFFALVNNNNDSADYIQDIKSFYIDLTRQYYINNLINRFDTDEKFANKVNRLIQAIDVNISSVKLSKGNLSYFNGEVELKPELGQVSLGTQNAFSRFLHILQVLEDGAFSYADELDASLHPHVVEFIIQLFYNKKINKNNAQLIFTTHDTSLLRQGLFRKDQVYFIEKDENQASKIFSIEDINDTDKDDFAKEYLKGRYGAIPILSDIEDIFDE